MHDTDQLIALIRSNKNDREKAIGLLYHDAKLQNGIKKIIGASINEHEDFNEIFNLTLVQLMKTVIEKRDFRITTNLNSYLFGTARNLWLMKLRKDKSHRTDELNVDMTMEADDVTIDLKIVDIEVKSNLKVILEKMGTNCKEVLMYWAGGYSMSEIAGLLTYSSEEVARKKKFLCMKQLSEYITTNPHLKTLIGR
jgi:RNA polymerase sigma factor (sigma-70 family)